MSGRFTSVDPIGSDRQLPQSMNKYVYVQNNPLKFTDPTGEELVVTGDYANEYISMLETATGYTLKRCTEVKGDCKKVGSVIINTSVPRKRNGTSNKLADILKGVIDLKDKSGKDVSVKINTAKNDEKIFFDSYDKRTVDVGDLAATSDKAFVAGQLAHVLGEYSQSDLLYGEGVNKKDAKNNPLTHQNGLDAESQVFSELYENGEENFVADPTREFSKFQYQQYRYNSDKTSIRYNIEIGYKDENGNRKLIFNVVTVKKSVVPK